MFDETMIMRLDFLRIDHAVGNLFFVIEMRPLNAEQQHAARCNMGDELFQPRAIVSIARNMAHHEGLFVAVDDEIPDAAIRESGFVFFIERERADILLAQINGWIGGETFARLFQHGFGQINAGDIGTRMAAPEFFEDEACAAADFQNIGKGSVLLQIIYDLCIVVIARCHDDIVI